MTPYRAAASPVRVVAARAPRVTVRVASAPVSPAAPASRQITTTIRRAARSGSAASVSGGTGVSATPSPHSAATAMAAAGPRGQLVRNAYGAIIRVVATPGITTATARAWTAYTSPPKPTAPSIAARVRMIAARTSVPPPTQWPRGPSVPRESGGGPVQTWVTQRYGPNSAAARDGASRIRASRVAGPAARNSTYPWGRGSRWIGTGRSSSGPARRPDPDRSARRATIAARSSSARTASRAAAAAYTSTGRAVRTVATAIPVPPMATPAVTYDRNAGSSHTTPATASPIHSAANAAVRSTPSGSRRAAAAQPTAAAKLIRAPARLSPPIRTR